MKWKSYNHGDQRNRVIFAIAPRKCEDGHWRWLERVEITERYYIPHKKPLAGQWEELSARKIK